MTYKNAYRKSSHLWTIESRKIIRYFCEDIPASKTSNLLNDSLREKIIAENNLAEHISEITGRSFVYCEKYDLIAHEEK